MASSNAELIKEVREMTGYTDEATLNNSEIRTVVERAKSRIISRKSLDASNGIKWYIEENASKEEALFWISCLFAKISTGELDAPGYSVENVDMDHLAAQGDREATEWARYANEALRDVSPAGTSEGSYGITSMTRDAERTYGGGDGFT